MRNTKVKKTGKANSRRKGNGKGDQALRESPPPRMKAREYVGYDMPEEEASDIRKDLKDGEKQRKNKGAGRTR